MRKLFALAMVALLSLTVAFAVVGCSKENKAEEATEESAEHMAAPDSGAMTDSMGNMVSDTTMRK